MNKYTVVCDFRAEGALTAVSLFDDESVIEMDSINDDGNEVYIVSTEWNIDSVLNNCSGVISYEKEEV